MADKKITELPVLTNATAHDSDVVPIVDVSVGQTHKMTLAELLLRFQGNPGPKGDPGNTGDPGPQGIPGVGVPNGGTTGQALVKKTNADADTEWKTLAKADVGLGNVDNTTDLDKPISTATQTALNGKQASLGVGANGQVYKTVAGVSQWADHTSIPTGGTTGQALVKNSNTDGDVTWTTIQSGVNVSSVQTLANSAVVTIGNFRQQRVKVQGNAIGVKVTVPNGNSDGDILYIMGTSDSQPVTIEDSSNCFINGSRTFTAGVVGALIWDATTTKWYLVQGV